MIRVAIIDDHQIVREGLKFTLPLQGDVEVVGEAGDGIEGVNMVKTVKPDVTLLDINMPKLDGLQALELMRFNNPKEKVIILTTTRKDNEVYTALKEGAMGYLFKDTDAGNILKAVRTVASGIKYISEGAAKLYAARRIMPDLTPKEQIVLEEMVKGGSNEQIAKAMDISVDGVKMHVKHLLGKLNVRDRTQAVAEAIRRGFVREG